MIDHPQFSLFVVMYYVLYIKQIFSIILCYYWKYILFLPLPRFASLRRNGERCLMINGESRCLISTPHCIREQVWWEDDVIHLSCFLVDMIRYIPNGSSLISSLFCPYGPNSWQRTWNCINGTHLTKWLFTLLA